MPTPVGRRMAGSFSRASGPRRSASRRPISAALDAPRSEGSLAPSLCPSGRRAGLASRSCPSGRAGPDIYVQATASGARPRQLTQAPGFDDTYPAWGPDGRRIAFVREDEFGTDYLYTMNADGTGVRFLLEAPDLCCPEWSPDGTLLALALNSEIVVVDPKRAGTPTRHGRGQQLLADVVAGRSLDRLRVRP